jgi:hypothetical protein
MLGHKMDIIRIYDENGIHVATLSQCIDDLLTKNKGIYDLSNPEGHVVQCDISKEVFDSFAKVLPIESF